MSALLLLAGGAFLFVCVGIIVFLIWKAKKKSASGGASSNNGDSLKEEIPTVLAAVKGEKAANVIASGFFANIYPNVKVVTSRASIPKSSPAFLLLTDASGTITGVEANSVLWDSGAAGPVA
jgi:hypothetical protein